MSRPHSENRFYNPPPVRRHQEQQLLLQQQHQQLQRHLQRPVKSESRAVHSVESEAAAATRADSDDSALSRPNSVCSSSPQKRANSTYLDRLVEAATPSVRAHFLPEVRGRGRQRREADSQQYFFLVDLWESYSEWSVYGVGVPLVLDESEPVKQYYVPSLSGIQLYIDPHRTRKHGEDTDAESLIEPSSGGSSDYEVERKTKGIVDGTWSQQNLMNLNTQRLNGLTLRDKLPMSSSSDGVNAGNSTNGQLIFEYMEYEQPHNRRPLYDQISNLASQFPDLNKYRSCDLSPESWIAVAWYPIYRIPVGSTLQNLDASFLTFHSLSTHPRSKVEPQVTSTSRKGYSGDASSKLCLPVFGIASYKLRGSILVPNSSQESQQVNSLRKAAADWLQSLQVTLPDYSFFTTHSSNWR